MIDTLLRDELLAMERADRSLRGELVARKELHGGAYHPEMAALHRRNNARMRAIIDAVGWPGRGLVGDDGCRAAGSIIQHASLDPDLQAHCLPLLEGAVAAGEAFPFMLAFLTDRVLMERGQPQRYGTQHVTGPGGALVPWPIAESETVDDRRRAMGLESLADRTEHLRAQVANETAPVTRRAGRPGRPAT